MSCTLWYSLCRLHNSALRVVTLRVILVKALLFVLTLRYTFLLIVIMIGQVAPSLGDLLLDILSLWVALLSLERPRNNILFPSPPPKVSISPWQSFFVNWSGSVNSFKIFGFLFHVPFLFTAIVKLSSTLLPILFPNGRHTSKLIVISCVMLSSSILFPYVIFELRFSLPMSSPKLISCLTSIH